MIIGGALGGVVVYRLARWASTPLARWLGLYRYYSPMMFTVPFGRNTVELHVGTSWDYFRTQHRSQHDVLRSLTQGLLAMVEEAERGQLPLSRKLRGTVYYFGGRTLSRFGFSMRSMNPIETVMFLLNWAELCLLYSITRGKICFVRVSDVRVVHTTVSALVEKKRELEALKRALGT
jgi:hypothetical protein